jgi:hypothetical protein
MGKESAERMDLADGSADRSASAAQAPRSLSDLKGNRLQIRLDGPFFAASLGNSSTIALRNRQKLSSPSRIFASILQVRQAPGAFGVPNRESVHVGLFVERAVVNDRWF